VIGATSLIGNRPTASELMTTAGRVLRISEPSVGSRLTSQISPRRGLLLLDVLAKVASLPLHPLVGLGHLLVEFGG
jgi:hypothetical protein